MRPLTKRAINKLLNYEKEMQPTCPFFVMEREGEEPEIVYTNGQFLLSWPTTEVDRESSGYHKLRDAARHPLAVGHAEALVGNCWRDFLFKKQGVFKDAEESEPTADQQPNVMAYCTTSRKQIYHYDTTFIEMAELFVEDPHYKLYWPPKTQNIARVLRMMAIFDGGALVGAIANIR